MHVHTAVVSVLVRLRAAVASRVGGDRGQATAEYALVLLGAAFIALLLVAWATGGGGAGRVGALFDKVYRIVTDKAG